MSDTVDSKKRWRMVIFHPDGSDEDFDLNEPGEYVIGCSARCQICLKDALVSPEHDKLTIASDAAEPPILVDLGSEGGTYVGETTLVPGWKYPVDHCMIVVLGRTMLQLFCE